MLYLTPPERLCARVLTRLPDAFRQPVKNDWVDANKPGHVLDSFLEGPAFDRAGNLYVTDIPYGRIFRITPALDWQLVVQYEGWPNGLAVHADGSLWITDYRRGLLRLDPKAGAQPTTLLGHRASESFKGVNDLVFDSEGQCYFTDQGQTGLHDPTGRVYRWNASNQRLDTLLATVPSPNGIALNADASALFVAVTRGNQVWRGPLLPNGTVSKVGALQTFFGTSGPDGLAMDCEGRLVVAHASLGAFVLAPSGAVTHVIETPHGGGVTNVAFRPGTKSLVMTDSQNGLVLEVDLPAGGQALYSHHPHPSHHSHL